VEKNSDRGLGFISGFVLGGVVGVVLGLLFAPRPGKNFREKWRGRLKDLLAQGKEIVQEAIEEGKEAAAREQTAFQDRFSSEE